MTPHATVAMPLYNMKQIATLALEGLCSQQTKYKWELIVCEEQTKQALGHDALIKYKERLGNAGCTNIKYISLSDWIPLGQKWKVIAEQADDTKCFLLQAGDCHAHNQRIENTCAAFEGDINYYDEAIGYFHSFRLNKTALFSPDDDYPHPCRLNMAWLTSLFKTLSDNDQRMGVDWYLYQRMKSKQTIKKFRNRELHETGVDVDGYNVISARDALFLKENKLIKPVEVDIFKNIPILEKYKGLALTKRFND